MKVLEVSESTLIDLCIESGMVPDNSISIWNVLAEWQLKILAHYGITNSSKVLDIGCGAMRLGLSLMNNFDDGKYYGIDPNKVYLDLGEKLASKYGLNNYELKCSEDFDFSAFNQTFDFIMCQSVVTHISKDKFEILLENLKEVVHDDTIFIFTYNLIMGPTKAYLYNDYQYLFEVPWFPSHEFISEIISEKGYKFEKIEFRHPTNQYVGIVKFN